MYFITTKRMLEVCFFQHTPTFIIEPEKTSTLMMADHRWYAAFYISCNDHKLLLMGFSEKVVKFYDRSVFIINIMPEFSKRQ